MESSVNRQHSAPKTQNDAGINANCVMLPPGFSYTYGFGIVVFLNPRAFFF